MTLELFETSSPISDSKQDHKSRVRAGEGGWWWALTSGSDSSLCAINAWTQPCKYGISKFNARSKKVKKKEAGLL